MCPFGNRLVSGLLNVIIWSGRESKMVLKSWFTSDALKPVFPTGFHLPADLGVRRISKWAHHMRFPGTFLNRSFIKLAKLDVISLFRRILWCWERLRARGEGGDRMRQLGSIIDSMGMSLNTLQEMVKDRGPWCTAVHGSQGVGHSLANKQQQEITYFKVFHNTLYCEVS